MTTKFGRKNSWSKCNALLRSKVMQGSAEVNQGSNTWACPMTTKFCRKNPWLKCRPSARGQLGSTRVKLLRYTLWVPNFVERTPTRKVKTCWGQSLCRGQLDSTRGQIAWKCCVATKFNGKNHNQSAMHGLGSKIMQGSARVNHGSDCPEMPYGNKIK